MKENDSEIKDSEDELLLGPDLGGGRRPYIRHSADNEITSGMADLSTDGKSCAGVELVSLTRIEGSRYRVETIYDGRTAHADTGSRKGPSTVVSDKYRDGWEAIFGAKRGQA